MALCSFQSYFIHIWLLEYCSNLSNCNHGDTLIHFVTCSIPWQQMTIGTRKEKTMLADFTLKSRLGISSGNCIAREFYYFPRVNLFSYCSHDYLQLFSLLPLSLKHCFSIIEIIDAIREVFLKISSWNLPFYRSLNLHAVPSVLLLWITHLCLRPTPPPVHPSPSRLLKDITSDFLHCLFCVINFPSQNINTLC